jgi:hypothetical protein
VEALYAVMAARAALADAAEGQRGQRAMHSGRVHARTTRSRAAQHVSGDSFVPSLPLAKPSGRLGTDTGRVPELL